MNSFPIQTLYVNTCNLISFEPRPGSKRWLIGPREPFRENPKVKGLGLTRSRNQEFEIADEYLQFYVWSLDSLNLKISLSLDEKCGLTKTKPINCVKLFMIYSIIEVYENFFRNFKTKVLIKFNLSDGGKTFFDGVLRKTGELMNERKTPISLCVFFNVLKGNRDESIVIKTSFV